jgi:hypothetical protein
MPAPQDACVDPLVLLLKLERSAVEAVTLPSGLRAIWKYMAKVASAGGTQHLDALHPVALIALMQDCGCLLGRPEAGPARS